MELGIQNFNNDIDFQTRVGDWNEELLIKLGGLDDLSIFIGSNQMINNQIQLGTVIYTPEDT